MTGNSREVMYTITNNEHQGKERRERVFLAIHCWPKGGRREGREREGVRSKGVGKDRYVKGYEKKKEEGRKGR